MGSWPGWLFRRPGPPVPQPASSLPILEAWGGPPRALKSRPVVGCATRVASVQPWGRGSFPTPCPPRAGAASGCREDNESARGVAQGQTPPSIPATQEDTVSWSEPATSAVIWDATFSSGGIKLINVLSVLK